jgi:hypothetical protein
MQAVDRDPWRIEDHLAQLNGLPEQRQPVDRNREALPGDQRAVAGDGGLGGPAGRADRDVVQGDACTVERQVDVADLHSRIDGLRGLGFKNGTKGIGQSDAHHDRDAQHDQPEAPRLQEGGHCQAARHRPDPEETILHHRRMPAGG